MPVPHLRVRWGWLAFPAALAIIATALLFETIRQSQPDGVGIWKDNSLAILLNTAWRSKRENMGVATSAQLERIADKLEATSLQGEYEGGRIVRRVEIRDKLG